MRDILVYVRHFDPWTRATQYGVRLAALLRGAVTGVYAYPSPLNYGAPIDLAPEVLAVMLENTRSLEARALQREEPFVSWATSQGAEQAAWLVAEGEPARVLAHLGVWHDLLVLDRSESAHQGSPSDLASLLLAADLPCILVPASDVGELRLDCIAIAWNGAPEAVRAIHASLPLLQRAGRVVLLAGAQREYYGVAWKPPFDIDLYLKRHGVRAERVPLSADDEYAGVALLAAAEKLSANLLVMGAYGRSRFSEWILGGATREVLAGAGLPVFLRH
ncbi:universal stress protein [Frateuria defendens]|uniref:universal stress protein n=1 Tax=Frateuria defendens TaxID=2219559 RepID=UPI00066FFAA7|nr:universal stress protein [Frateuria defendens]